MLSVWPTGIRAVPLPNIVPPVHERLLRVATTPDAVEIVPLLLRVMGALRTVLASIASVPPLTFT